MQNNNKYNKGLEVMGKKEKLKNVFDELFGSFENHEKVINKKYNQMSVSLGILNTQGVMDNKENTK